jgi:penicillin-binding protein 2
MNMIIKRGRLISFIILLIALVIIYVTALYKLQIIEGAASYEKSRNSIVTTQTVTAARGDILDRYGRLLVSNRVCNNLMIDTDELFAQDDPNSIILEMVEMVKSYGDTYTDTLPITMEAPFEYVSNMSDIQRTRLNAYLKDKGMPEDTTAVELMAYFRDRYDIDNSYDSEQMRIIAGIRYELNIRYIINTSDYIFVEDASIELITKLMEWDVPGIHVDVSYIREYNTSYASHILGYIGMMDEEEYEEYGKLGYPLNAMVGKDGVEEAFEEYLHGTDGEAKYTSTAAGTVTGTVYTKEPEPGNHVYLTIDIGLQEAAEKALANGITKLNEEREAENAEAVMNGKPDEVKQMAEGGGLVAIDVKTGEPLAIASYPGYDLTNFMENYSEILEADNNPLFNRALQGTYAPGSTFKMVTALAALNEGVTTVDYTVYDEGKFRKYEDAGYAPTCWIWGTGSHGNVNVTRALTVSCNYYFYTIGDFLGTGRDGIDTLASYAYRFGLGSKTGIELPESLGVMSTWQYKEELEGVPWYAGDMLQAAIGQDYSLFTPLQLGEYIATVADGGTRHSASLLKTVRSYDYSDKLFERKTEVLDEVKMDESYYQAVWQGMYGVANEIEGTAYAVFNGYPVTVAAKTGTAQLGEKVTNNGVFVCYAPYEDPQIAIALVVEKGSAGSAIASIAKDVLDYYFNFQNSTITLETDDTLLK